MDIFLQVVISGLTVGAMYAAGTIALSLLWSSMGMLNLANGAFYRDRRLCCLLVHDHSYTRPGYLHCPWLPSLGWSPAISFTI